jgi:hypothetical protein
MPNWRKAMIEEMMFIEENDTWSLIDLLPSCTQVGVQGEVG